MRAPKTKADGVASGMFLLLRPRVGVPCPVIKRGLTGVVMGRGGKPPPCHGGLTGLPRLTGCRDVVPEDGSTMSDDGTHCRVRAILRGGSEGESKQVDPSRASRCRASERSAKHRRLASGRGGPNEPFVALAQTARGMATSLSSRCTACLSPWPSLISAAVTMALGGLVGYVSLPFCTFRPQCTHTIPDNHLYTGKVYVHSGGKAVDDGLGRQSPCQTDREHVQGPRPFCSISISM